MKKWRIALLLSVLIIAVVVPAGSIFATDQPDSAPSATFYLYRSLLETGDQLLLIDQNIPYSTIPDEPIWQTYQWRMIALDGVTELGICLPYAFNDNGYGSSVASMYWDAGNVTALGMAWDAAYTMRLSENPALFASPTQWDFTLSSADYSTLTVSEDVKDELAARILLLAQNLDISWGLGATYSLLNETETGTVLSIYGEAFFRGAIYGLQGLCPQVFAYVINDVDLTPRTFSAAYVTTLSNQWSGTWVETAKAAGAALFGTGYDLTSILLTLLAAVIIAIIAIILSGDAWHGIADAKTVFIVSTRLGFFDLGFLAVLAACAVLYGTARMWGVLK